LFDHKFEYAFWQDSPNPLANSLLQPKFAKTLILELDWLSLWIDENDPLVLCIVGAYGSFRLVEINPQVIQISLQLENMSFFVVILCMILFLYWHFIKCLFVIL